MNSNIGIDRSEHTLSLASRKELKITGVRQILNFDDKNVAFVTSDGELDITFKGIKIPKITQRVIMLRTNSFL